MEINRNITLATKTIHTKFYSTYFKLEQYLNGKEKDQFILRKEVDEEVLFCQ